MTTTLANARIQLSKEIGDYFAGTVTSTSTEAVYITDTSLKAKANDWISDAPQEMYDFIATDTSTGTVLNEERKITSLDNTSGLLTVLAHSNKVGLGVGYEIHRMFSASDKRTALIYACKSAFPALYAKILDTSKTTGNWLLNGDFEKWSVSTYPDSWGTTSTGLTQTKTTTAKLYTRGATSLAITGDAGYVSQTWTNNDDLKYLRGCSVTFKAMGAKSDTASSLRLAIYDGTTTTYSDYHSGNSAWASNNDDDFMYVVATIDDDATEVSFRIYHNNAAATDYVDDLRVIGPIKDRIYIGDLGLAQNTPNSVEVMPEACKNWEKWDKVYNWSVDSDGYLLLPNLQSDLRIRIKGMGYLDFLASGVSSTAWTATVAVDAPQLYILTAEAVMYLYTQLIMPNFTTGDREQIAKILQYWQVETEQRKLKYGMPALGATANWGL